MLAVIVCGICLLGIVKLMSNSQRSLTQSLGSLQAQASAEELLQQIRLMKWDRGSVPGTRMSMAAPPSVTSGSCTDPIAVEDWNGCPDLVDNSRPAYGPFRRTVRVVFLALDAGGRLVESPTATDRKGVTVTAEGRTFSATITSVFYNLP